MRDILHFLGEVLLSFAFVAATSILALWVLITLGAV